MDKLSNCVSCQKGETDATVRRALWTSCKKCGISSHISCAKLAKPSDTWICSRCDMGPGKKEGKIDGVKKVDRQSPPPSSIPKIQVSLATNDPDNVEAGFSPGISENSNDTYVPAEGSDAESFHSETFKLAEEKIQESSKMLADLETRKQRRLQMENLYQQLSENTRRIEELQREEAEWLEQQRAGASQFKFLPSASKQNPIDSSKNVNLARNTATGTIPKPPKEFPFLNPTAEEFSLAKLQVPLTFGQPESMRTDTENSDKRMRNKNPANGMENELQKPSANDLMVDILLSQMKLVNRQQLGSLPIFSGNVNDWPLFISQYESSTQIGDFSDTENMIRLRTSLKGAALETAQAALTLPENSAGVIEILRKSYGRQDVLVELKMKDLESLSAPNVHKPATVKAFFEFLQGFCATLTNAGAFDYLHAPNTLNSIERKLPMDVRARWYRHYRANNNRTINGFLTWYEPTYEVAVWQTLEAIGTGTKDEKKVHRVHAQQENREEKDLPRSNSNQSCNFCKKYGHSIYKCSLFEGKPLGQRWQFLRTGGWCFCCLVRHHRVHTCDKKKECGVEGCVEIHHKLLHKKQSAKLESGGEKKIKTRDPKIKDQEAKSSTDKEKEEPRTSASNFCYNQATYTHFRLVPVTLWNGEKQYTTWAFLDEGSGPTLVSQKVSRTLGLTGESSELCLKWSNGQLVKHESEIVSFKLSGANEKKKFQLDNVHTVPSLDLPAPRSDLRELAEKFQHLNGVTIPEVPFEKPEILIGLEHVKLMTPAEVREGSWREPIAVRTQIGWAIYGKAQDPSAGTDAPSYSCHVCECTEKFNKLDKTVQSFFTTESFGTVSSEKKLQSAEEKRVNEIFDSTIKLKDNRYECGLLWKMPDVQMPNNRSMAEKRLECFERKLLKDPEQAKIVNEKIQLMIDKEYLIETPVEDVRARRGKSWFLPVFAVTNPLKPGKLRLVYDAAARYDGVSLNEFLLTGPENLLLLFGVLLRFRQGRIGFCGDIAEMFHRVKLKPEDQFFQLILWRFLNTKMEPRIFRLAVTSFGATCSPSVSQEIKNRNASRFEKDFPRAVKSIQRATYMDDDCDSANTVEEAIKIAKDVRHIHAEGGFEIRNWISNSKAFVEALNQTQSFTQNLNMDLGGSDGTEKVLGMYWNTATDMFEFRLSFHRVPTEIIEQKTIPTKRQVLKVVMAIFDPFGMVAPIVLAGKVLIQSLWRSGCKWDEQIPDQLVPGWQNWLKALENIKNVRMPRWLSPIMQNFNRAELHTFCDASEWAFSAITYLRLETIDGQVDVSFVAAKTRVAPTKQLSINRLELQALVTGIRLAKTLQQEIDIKIDALWFWVDSQTTAGWTRSVNCRYSPFVAQRVGEILDFTSARQIRWLPSNENVADEATKWDKIPQVSDRFLHGPEFLKKSEENWPQEKVRIVTPDEEAKNIQYHLNVTKMSTQFDMIQPERFSNWNRLVRAVAFARHYLKILRDRLEARKCDRPVSKLAVKGLKRKEINVIARTKAPLLIGSDIEWAETILLTKAQQEDYGVEMEELKTGQPVPKNSKILNLNPIIVRGIIRVETRLDYAPVVIDPDVRRPVILNGSNKITQLIIKWFHNRFHHQVRETVINELRAKFWIPNIRAAVSKVIKSCLLCSILKAKPRVPRMAPLPTARIDPHTAPFTHTGLDFMGPFEITIYRRKEKRWIALFTCLTMRAVHLEVAHSLNTSSAVMVVKNFMNRRGRPLHFWTDNGTNLKAAEKELRLALEAIKQDDLITETQSLEPGDYRTEWTFNPPTGAHHGGAWERLVRTVKQSLYFALKATAPKEETFRATVIEIENTVNSRPLNYTSSTEVLLPAITPNSLLQNTQRATIHPPIHILDSRKQWAVSQELAHKFWTRWLKEYLPTISVRPKWRTETESLKVGQLVFMIEAGTRRGEWPRGVVEKVFTGPDNRIRSALVKTAYRKKPYHRPVTKLAIINEAADEQ